MDEAVDARDQVVRAERLGEGFARGGHLGENLVRVLEQVFTRLGEQHLFTHPVKKAAAEIGLQRLHGMADGGLGEVQFARSLGETAAPRERDKSP